MHEGVFFKQQAAARLLIQHVCCCIALRKIIHTVFVFRQPEHDVHSRVSGRAGTRPTTSGWCGTCTFLLEVLQHGYSMCGSYSPLWLCGKHDAAAMRTCAQSLNLLSAQCNSIQVLLLVILSSAHGMLSGKIRICDFDCGNGASLMLQYCLHFCCTHQTVSCAHNQGLSGNIEMPHVQFEQNYT